MNLIFPMYALSYREYTPETRCWCWREGIQVNGEIVQQEAVKASERGCLSVTWVRV